MTDFVFNIAKGREAYYASLPATSDGLVWVPLEATGLEADATLKDYDTLAALLAGATNEQTTMGRKAATGVTVTVDDTGEKVVIDLDDPTWTAPPGNAVAKLLLCYDPDTAAGTDADVVPLLAWDFAPTLDGSDKTAQVNASGAVSIS